MTGATRVSLRRLGALGGVLVVAWLAFLPAGGRAQGGAPAPAPDTPRAGAVLGPLPDAPPAAPQATRSPAAAVSTSAPARGSVATPVAAPRSAPVPARAVATLERAARPRAQSRPARRAVQRPSAVRPPAWPNPLALLEELPYAVAAVPLGEDGPDRTLTALAGALLAVVALGGGVLATAAGRLVRQDAP